MERLKTLLASSNFKVRIKKVISLTSTKRNKVHRMLTNSHMALVMKLTLVQLLKVDSPMDTMTRFTIIKANS
jgi:hypothetical protein